MNGSSARWSVFNWLYNTETYEISMDFNENWWQTARAQGSATLALEPFAPKLNGICARCKVFNRLYNTETCGISMDFNEN